MAHKQFFRLKLVGGFVVLLAIFLALFVFKADIARAAYPCTADSCGCGTVCDGLICVKDSSAPTCPTPTPTPAIAPNLPTNTPVPTTAPGSPTNTPVPTTAPASLTNTPVPTTAAVPTPTPNPNCVANPGSVISGDCSVATNCSSSTSSVSCTNNSCVYTGNLTACPAGSSCPTSWVPGGWGCSNAPNSVTDPVININPNNQTDNDRYDVHLSTNDYINRTPNNNGQDCVPRTEFYIGAGTSGLKLARGCGYLWSANNPKICDSYGANDNIGARTDDGTWTYKEDLLDFVGFCLDLPEV